MRVITGLGNPGKEYRGTPHNFGFEVIERLAQRWDIRMKKSRVHEARMGKGLCREEEVVLIQPLTYMNLSGTSLKPFLKTDTIEVSDFFIICDDVNLPVGRIRIRKSGSAGGHKGLKSIIGTLGSNNFPRLRIGAGISGEPIDDLVSYVLSPVMKKYRSVIEEILDLAPEIVEYCILNGFDKAMSIYNGLDLLAQKDN